MSLAVFLPTRKGSVRIPEKNTRQFADFSGGLLELKLKQLIEVEEIDEIILSTNDERSVEISKPFTDISPKLKVSWRPDVLASSETDLTDLIKYVPQLTEADTILWTHVTSPFFSEACYQKAISTYQEKLKGNFDSLVSVSRFQNFLWDEEVNDIINRIGNRKWPRTQDLKTLYELNNAVFMAPRHFYKEGERLGNKPFLLETEKIPSLDIDELGDFHIAEAIYEKNTE